MRTLAGFLAHSPTVSWIVLENRIRSHHKRPTMNCVGTNQRMRVACGRWQHARHCRANSCSLPWCRGLKCRLQVETSSSEAPIIVDGQNYGSFHQVLPSENAYIMSVCRRRENVCVDQEGYDENVAQNNKNDENEYPVPSSRNAVENRTYNRDTTGNKIAQNSVFNNLIPLRERP